jgi:hypothetical protein
VTVVGIAANERAWVDERHLATHLAKADSPSIAILDFDETLWLRNSTEEFLEHVRPRILVVILLQVLGTLKPWRWLSRSDPEHYRDWIRVGAVLLVAPWSVLTWRFGAKQLGPRYFNAPLLNAVVQCRPGRIVVATFGFRFIVEPLLTAADQRVELLLSSSMWRGAALRKTGKARALQSVLDRNDLTNALFVTDSAIDSDAGDLCGRPFYIRWEKAEYRQAGLRPLLPLAYTARVKRPNERYILHGIVGYDLAVGFLAYALASSNVIGTAVSLAFYLLGFFAVYEIGYYENDTAAQKREAKPVLSRTFAELGSYFSVRAAWSFGLLLLALGAAVQTLTTLSELEGSWRAAFEFFAAHWLLAVVLVVGTRLTFHWFNSLSPRHRTVPMLALQLERTLGYALMLPLSWAGALLCVCHAFGRWFPYAIYRFGGERKKFPSHLFAFLLFAMASAGRLGEFFTAQFLIIAGYLALRAAKDGYTFIGHGG